MSLNLSSAPKWVWSFVAGFLAVGLVVLLVIVFNAFRWSAEGTFLGHPFNFSHKKIPWSIPTITASTAPVHIAIGPQISGQTKHYRICNEGEVDVVVQHDVGGSPLPVGSCLDVTANGQIEVRYGNTPGRASGTFEVVR